MWWYLAVVSTRAGPTPSVLVSGTTAVAHLCVGRTCPRTGHAAHTAVARPPTDQTRATHHRRPWIACIVSHPRFGTTICSTAAREATGEAANVVGRPTTMEKTDVVRCSLRRAAPSAAPLDTLVVRLLKCSWQGFCRAWGTTRFVDPEARPERIRTACPSTRRSAPNSAPSSAPARRGCGRSPAPAPFLKADYGEGGPD